MSKTIVNIITEDNPIPAYLFIKEMYKEGDKLMYISAKDTEDDLDALSDMFSVPAYNIEEIVLKHNMDEFTYEKICRTVKVYLKEDVNYCVNLAGGTRYMALAVQQVFEDYNATFYYVQVEENMIVKSKFDDAINNDDDYFYPISYRMKIAEYLRAHEINHDLGKYRHVPSYSKAESVKMYNLYVYEEINSEYRDTLKALRENCRKRSQIRIREVEKSHGKNEPLVPKLSQFLARINFIPRTSGILNRQEIDYLKGGWFEEYVYYLVKRYVKPQDLALGVRIWRRNVRHNNELDVIFTKGNKLFVIECKTGVGSDSLFNDIVYKACAIKEALLGVSCCSYIFSLKKDDTNNLKRIAELMDITFLDHDILTMRGKRRKALAYMYVKSRDGVGSLLKSPTRSR